MLKKFRKSNLLSTKDPEKYYDIGEVCGSGTYGKVYRAKRKTDGVAAAFKAITLDLTDEEDLIKEIEALRHCHHPNIVEFFEAFTRKKDMVIIMELCAGGAVGDIRKEYSTPFSDQFLFYVIRETIRALEHLRDVKVLHRDIKGGNIFLTEQGEVKLGDFGIAAICTPIERRNSFIGTPYWMAPEVIACDEDNTQNTYDYACDVWSLGITTIELIDGNPPLHELHPIRAINKILNNQPPSVTHPLYKDNHAVHHFLKMCLERDPRKRACPSSLLKEEIIDCLPDDSLLRKEARLITTHTRRKMMGENLGPKADSVRDIMGLDYDTDNSHSVIIEDENFSGDDGDHKTKRTSRYFDDNDINNKDDDKDGANVVKLGRLTIDEKGVDSKKRASRTVMGISGDGSPYRSMDSIFENFSDEPAAGGGNGSVSKERGSSCSSFAFKNSSGLCSQATSQVAARYRSKKNSIGSQDSLSSSLSSMHSQVQQQQPGNRYSAHGDMAHQIKKSMTIRSISSWATDPRSQSPSEKDIESFLDASIRNKHEKQLVYAINLAQTNHYKSQRLTDAIQLYENIIELNKQAKHALETFDIMLMDEALVNADVLYHNSPLLERLRGYVHNTCQRFLQAKLKHAQQSCNTKLVALATYEIKQYFASVNASMFQLKEYGFLKHPKDFETVKNKHSHEKFNRSVFDQSPMLYFQKSPIKCSMLKLEPKLQKMAVQAFNFIQIAMGDQPGTDVDRTAALQSLIDYAFSSIGIRDELYCQLMKQLTRNPSSSSLEKGWLIMEVIVRTFAPSNDFSNFVEHFLHKHAPDTSPAFTKEDFLNAYYTTLLIPPCKPERDAIKILETSYTPRMDYISSTLTYYDKISSRPKFNPLPSMVPTPWPINPC